ncbi:MAG: hypothetical protein P1U85_11675 [Verrucomicrobiales bacterium]|nr:hypothetical protein [Verrucomicrobiales bacterium]
MIETEGEFLVRKWGWTLLVIALGICGTISIITQESYFPQGGRGTGGGFVKISGQQAVFAGLAYIGIGIALLGNFVLPYSDKLHTWERIVFSSGLILTIVGIALVIWRFLSP